MPHVACVAEWVQGDGNIRLFVEHVHVWPDGEAEPYRLSGSPDAAVVVTALKETGAILDSIRLLVEVKKTEKKMEKKMEEKMEEK